MSGLRGWRAVFFACAVLAVSGLTAFITGTTSFLIMRFLLGAAEAGFFPGMILYFTYWFPSEYRGRVISTLFIAQPVANAAASIASAAILGMDGWLGIKGWQWIFIIEALPAVLLGMWLGLNLYGKLNEATFRIVVLILLLISGLTLLPSAFMTAN